jgi:hypothetical protein
MIMIMAMKYHGSCLIAWKVMGREKGGEMCAKIKIAFYFPY